jgi:guanine nucleotide-binding protein G(t) subunit alpha 3
LLDGLQEFSESEQEKYTLLPENKAIGEKLTEIGNRTQQPPLTEELAQQIEALWKDPAIQVKTRKLKALLHKKLNWLPFCTYFLFTHLQAKQTEDVQSGITFDQASVV